VSSKVSRGYRYNIDTTRKSIKRAIRESSFDIVDDDRSANKVVFESKKSLFKWTIQQYTMRYIQREGSIVEVSFMAHDDNDQHRATKISSAIFTRLEHLLPNKKR